MSEDVLLLYASTSGSTRMLCESLVAHFSPERVKAVSLHEVTYPWSLPSARLLVLTSPTYGTGDPHQQWMEKGEDIISLLPPGQQVAILVIGDARGHRSSFAGSLRCLADLVRKADLRLVGSVPAQIEPFFYSPAVEHGSLPGLAVEFRRNRHQAIASAQRWLADLIA